MITTLQDTLKKQKLLFDGAFGTYYALVYDTKELPERANTEYSERVIKIHKEYIEAGAQIIRTNTFASNTASLDISSEAVMENIRCGYRLAKEAAREKNVYIAADIGQIPYEPQAEYEHISKEYVEICRTFLEEGADIFVIKVVKILMSKLSVLRENWMQDVLSSLHSLSLPKIVQSE